MGLSNTLSLLVEMEISQITKETDDCCLSVKFSNVLSSFLSESTSVKLKPQNTLQVTMNHRLLLILIIHGHFV